MIHISKGYVTNYSFDLVVVTDLYVFELSQMRNGNPAFVFERMQTRETFVEIK